MSNDRLPCELDCSNLASEWKNWKRNFLMYMIATNKIAETEARKIATFLWLVGPKASDIFNTLFPNDSMLESIFVNHHPNQPEPEHEEPDQNEDEEEADDDAESVATVAVGNENGQLTLELVLKKFDEYCLPRKNTTMETFKFNTIVQKDKQSFAEFETELRKQISYCEFNCKCGVSYEDRMLRDRIIIGVCDKNLQLKLLDGKNDPLKNVVEKCKTFEAATANKNILDKGVKTLNEVKTEPTDYDGQACAVYRACFNCGGPYKYGHMDECRAKRVTCNKCLKVGHFSKFCRGNRKMQPGKKDDSSHNGHQDKSHNGHQDKSQNGHQDKSGYNVKKTGNNKEVNTLTWDSSGKIGQCNGDLVGLFNSRPVFRINSVFDNSSQWTKTYLIGSEPVKFKIDSGSDVNCIPINVIKKIKKQVNNSNINFSIFDYSNNKIKIFGTIVLICIDSISGIKNKAEFLVVDNCFTPLLGLKTSVEFGLIKRLDVQHIKKLPYTESEFLSLFSDIFEGLGHLATVSIHLKENSKPVLHYKKRIPHSLVDRLKLELNKMESDGIISAVEYPTDWVNNIQIVEKANKTLRICLDPKPLNECIKREHFLIPTAEDLFSKISNKNIFTVLDLKSGFWQMELDKSSSDLTTFMTPFGRYKFHRVPFGLNCAPEIFQREMVKHFGDIPGLIIYFDDICIVANDEKEHDEILLAVINRARAHNVRFNAKKIQYRKNEVSFMGHIISANQIRPCHKHCDAILNMPTPQNKGDVMRLLGLFKYLARFIPNLSQMTAYLRDLTKNDRIFNWNKNHETELSSLLKIISSAPVLKPYNPNGEVLIQTDASKDGLGCVLLQDGHPVSYASRTLASNEQKWAQIEKELLAIVFACSRFHLFLYGREFTVHSDHKPLENLFKRDIDDVTPRLQRMFMFLLKYPCMKIVYKPGKEMLVADCLSRAQLPDQEEIVNLTGVIHSVSRNVCLSKENFDLYRQIIENDNALKKICYYVEQEWPQYQRLSELEKTFHKYKSELHFENGLLFKNHKLVIPVELQNIIIKWLHAPHLGIEKTLARARMLYFWPKMTEQIKDIIAKCTTCETFRRNNTKETLKQDDSPTYPFQKISMDIFEYSGKYFLSVIDSYSGYLMVENLRSKTTENIVERLRQLFDRMGYPTVIRCDNSPFGSMAFEKFAEECNTRIIFSSPRYPQSNGLAEKGVAIAKNLLKRCLEDGRVNEYQYRILEYNTTPVASMGLTPAHLFFGRLIKTKLPMTEQILHRINIKEDTIETKFEKKKEKQKFYFDRNARNLPVLEIGDRIIFKKTKEEWNYGIIVENINGRSYIIKDNYENYFRRNRRFIVKTKNNKYNPSEILYEDHVRTFEQDNANQLEPISITPSTNNKMEIPRLDSGLESNPSLNNNNLRTTSDTSVLRDAGSANREEPLRANIPENVINSPYRTKSGRVSAPPNRLGID